ncbi:transmembrane protein 216 isoform X1 [Gambusia affinis]|uniref:transmembrane protein 216 isoform X1 n=1 Tax=Gambusia affinis TaxID=33528 RepID=UPI001CDD130A|nr:transmembrane protein 216 isoform X1 [Gambusia affinis]
MAAVQPPDAVLQVEEEIEQFPSHFHSNQADSIMAPGSHVVLSSTPLQVLLYLNSWYFSAFYLAEILMFIYKGILLPYPADNLVLDVVLLLLFLALETLRIFYGWKGNLCERSLSSCVSLFILFPCTALAVYYLLLQTFVLRLEFILSAVLLCFYGLEFLICIISISAFSSLVYVAFPLQVQSLLMSPGTQQE